jgi:DNA-binding beta-propeller fold protein YncE
MEIMENRQATFQLPKGSKSPPMRLILFAPLAVAACTASAEEVSPHSDEIRYPTGAAVAPDDSVLFVANANSDLKYDSGSISVIRLATVDKLASDWTTMKMHPSGDSNGNKIPDCSPDPDHTETLTCEAFILLSETLDAGVRVGNFATDVAVQDLGNGALRLIVPTRGDPSIAWADWDGSRLTCNSSSDGFGLCDDAHRLSFINDDVDQPIKEEPFSVFADTAGQFAVVTHLTTGAVTLIDSPRDGNAIITDMVEGAFLPDPNTGARGATGVVGRTPLANDDLIYVGSRAEDRIMTFSVGRPVNNSPPYLLPESWFFLNEVGGTTGGSTDTRGMAFSQNGERLYLVNRRPPSLQIFDTSVDASGAPKNTPVGATDMCRQASTVTVADTGDGDRVFVSCFQDGQIYVVNPNGFPHAEDIVTVGRGPYSVVAATSRKKLYVTNFLEDTIAVIDIAAGSPTRNRVVLRIGIPRQDQ